MMSEDPVCVVHADDVMRIDLYILKCIVHFFSKFYPPVRVKIRSTPWHDFTSFRVIRQLYRHSNAPPVPERRRAWQNPANPSAT
jgi:hypothetical protein